MIYTESTHVAQFFDTKHIKGFCDVFLNTYEEVVEKNKSIGVKPMMKNLEHGFYSVDYGFVVYVLEVYVKLYAKLVKKDEALGIEIARNIHRDFARDDSENLTKNSTFLMCVLALRGIYFSSKKSRTLYTQVLFRNNRLNTFMILNSVSFNLDVVLEIANRKDISEFSIVKKDKIIEQVAYGSNANSVKKALGKSVPIYQFWSRDKDYNGELLQ